MRSLRLNVIAAGLGVAIFATRAAAAQSPAPAAGLDPAALAHLIEGLTVTPRVLVLSLRPRDEDSELLAWLARVRNVETASLSITRGESDPNLGGIESGSALGVLHVQEALAARRIDGAQQYFTRAYDFGFARDTADVFARGWTRDSVVADVVAVIRAFRPQVMIVSVDDSAATHDALAAATLDIARRAFDAAAEPRGYPIVLFGAPWRVTALYQHGPGLEIATNAFDPLLAADAVTLGRQARAEQRSSGLAGIMRRPATIALRRIAFAASDTTSRIASLFDGVDTAFSRLERGATADIAADLRNIALAADSARRVVDLRETTRVVPLLARIVGLTNVARAGAPWCSHAASVRLTAAQPILRCSPAQLDLDAALDVLRARSTAALLAAAGVSLDAVADRELVATGDSATVTIRVTNHGDAPVTIMDASLWGGAVESFSAIAVPPDSTGAFTRRIAGIDDAQPWWIGERAHNRYPGLPSAADGLSRGAVLPMQLAVPAVAVPESIRRTSDATLTLVVAGTPVITSIGPVRYPYADASVGLQWRAIAGVPAVTLRFQHALEWIRRGEPITRSIHVALASHADRPVSFALRTISPPTVHAVGLADSITLAPGERREMFVQLRGALRDTARAAFVLIGKSDTTTRYENGYQTIQRDYLPPIRLSHTSGAWLQPIDVRVPRELTVLYLASPNDDVASALTQIGVVSREVTAEQLLNMDLTPIRTIAIGPHALEAQPELLGQSGRLLDFVRRGGTLVVLHDNPSAAAHLLPFPVDLAPGHAEHVLDSASPIRVLTASRLLRWPNAITDADWQGWVSGRAASTPAEADPRYARSIATNDAGQSENQNSILFTHLGRGTVVYTSLSLDEQIAGGISGGLRLLVNLLSAGLTAAP